MPRYFLLFTTALWLHAGMLDFQTIEEAQKAYGEGQYEKAASLFSTIAGKNDEARFNYADALYKSQQYKPAIEQYGRIPEQSALKARALYNAGNAHAQLGELDKAEQAYANALKVAKEEALKEDIAHNLDVIKKEKERQEEKEQNNDGDKQQQNKDQNRSDRQDQQGDQSQKQPQDGQQQDDRDKKQQNSPTQQQKPSGGASSSQSSSGRQQGQQSSEPRKEERSEREQQGAAHSATAEEVPISDMEERKYNQMLDKRGIRTLMVPLNNKGEPRENETTPW